MYWQTSLRNFIDMQNEITFSRSNFITNDFGFSMANVMLCGTGTTGSQKRDQRQNEQNFG